MKVMGIVGWSGSGKTTLITRVIPVLAGRGLRVSTVKHAHHRFDVDRPGKDSHAHREAGAVEVLVGSAQRWALMHELRGAPEPSLDDLLGRMSPVDLVLVEGFKTHAHDKIEVWRVGAAGEPLWRTDPDVVAVAVDFRLSVALRSEISVPLLDVDDPEAVADFVVDRCGLAAA